MDYSKLIKKIGLKANSQAVLEEAFEKGWISGSEIKDMLPLSLSLEKNGDAITLMTLKLENALKEAGIIIIGKHEKKQKSEFSIVDFPIFSGLSDDELRVLVSLFHLPTEKQSGAILHEENCVFFVACGAITIDTIDDKERERMLQFIGQNDIFAVADDLHATVRSEYAYLWQCPLEKLGKISPLAKNFILYYLKSQVENLRRYRISTITDSQQRIRQFCQFLDEKYVERFNLTHDTIGSAVCFTRETVTRKK